MYTPVSIVFRCVCVAGAEDSSYYCSLCPGMILDNHCKCWIREYINIKKMRFKWTLDHGNPTFAVRIIILYVETGVYCVQVCLCWGRDAARGDPGRGERWLAPEVTWPRSARPSVRSGSTDTDQIAFIILLRGWAKIIFIFEISDLFLFYWTKAIRN